MKTKMTYREFKNIEIVSAQLKRTYVYICNEWRQDLTKDGNVKWHSKEHKAMKKLRQAFEALDELSTLIEHELD